MPGFYAAGEYDVAGFIVGVVARGGIIDGRHIVAGDQLLALPSSGLHTNGYSLARRIVFDVLGLQTGSHVAELGTTAGEALLRPHRSYLRVVGPLLAGGVVKGMAHITGGGITENLPRVLPDGLTFSLDRGGWTVPPLFKWLQAAGGVAESEMFRAFNMGVGMVLVCTKTDLDGVLADLRRSGEPAWRLGEVVPADAR
jgi:phosphoribosylformylglycinamidine cyclo-ligase